MHGVGFAGTTLVDLTPPIPNDELTGTLTLMAYTPPKDAVNRVQVFDDNSTSALTFLKDDGLNGDQFAGDGLYTRVITNYEQLEGDYRIDFIPIQLGPYQYGDAYPRFRVHAF